MPTDRSAGREPGFPRTILFDLDDTLFDHSLTCRAALVAVRRRYGALRGRPLDELSREYDRLLGVLHREVQLGHRSSEDARAERFERLAAWNRRPVAPAAAREMSDAYRALYLRLRRPVPGAPEAVRRLGERARIGVVTNNTLAEQRDKLEFLGLDRRVDFLVASAEVGVAKPDVRIFREALARAGTPAAETVMIGDAWESDILGARAAGIRAVWFNRFRRARPTADDVPEFRSFRPLGELERRIGAG